MSLVSTTVVGIQAVVKFAWTLKEYSARGTKLHIFLYALRMET